MPLYERLDWLLKHLQLPVDERPSLMTLYIDDIDKIGHQFGPDSPELNCSLAKIDHFLEILIMRLRELGIFETTDIIVVSDHGMLAANPDDCFFPEKFLDKAKIELMSFGPICLVYPKSDEDLEEILFSLETKKEESQAFKVYKKNMIPKEFSYGQNARVAPIVIVAEPGWSACPLETKQQKGMHGYSNFVKEMQAIFIGHGPSFIRNSNSFHDKSKRIEPFRLVDIYNLLAGILQITPDENDGTDFLMENCLANKSSK